MKYLFVSHSLGDTEAIIQVAVSFLEKPDFDGEINFLPIGQAALDKFLALDESHILHRSPKVRRYSLKNILGLDSVIDLDDKVFFEALESRNTLKSGALNKIKAFVEYAGITSALIGTPSQITNQIPFQLAQALQETLQVSFYHDYLFFEPDHYIWHSLFITESDTEKKPINWFFASDKAKQKALSVRSNAKVEMVGHPMFDQVEPAVKDETIRSQLNIGKEETFIFISGTTLESDADKVLLTAIAEASTDESVQDLQIRFGIHPGHRNLKKYLADLEEVIAKFPNLAGRVKLILSPIIERKCEAQDINIKEEHYVKAPVSGAQATESADGVACAVPATLVSKAVLCGDIGFSADPDRESFLDTDKFFTGSATLPLFLEKAKQAKAARKVESAQLQSTSHEYDEALVKRPTFGQRMRELLG